MLDARSCSCFLQRVLNKIKKKKREREILCTCQTEQRVREGERKESGRDHHRKAL